MQAVRYTGPNKPFVLETVAKPSPGPNELLIQVRAAALCHTELHFADGTLNLGVSPITMGHEAAGVVVEAGLGAEGRVGERVVVYYYVGCGSCRWCAKGEQQLCGSVKAQFGFVSDGGLAEYLVAPSRNCVVLPESLSFERAAPIGCGVTTAVHAAKIAQVEKGEWAAVYGVNGVGFGLVQLLKHQGLRVIAITRNPKRREQAVKYGADIAIDSTDASSVAAAVRVATNGDGETMDACVGWNGALGKRGRLVMIGYTAGDEHNFRLHPIPMIVYEQKIMGSVGATLEDLKESIQLVASGAISTLVDSTLPLAKFQDGLDRIKSCDCFGKVVCVP